jgi:O-acetyl-ADP-ribose deacetylase (regulator of RNase III)
MSISLHVGSILDCEVDAIVNPANSFLRHSGGLARVIANAAAPPPPLHADPEYTERVVDGWLADHESAPLIATGNVHVTSAGCMPFKGVIHAVGPIWNGGHYCEQDLIEIVHERIFETALQEGYRSIAVPAISCGIFGCPVDLVARIAVQVAAAAEDDLDITFAVMGDEHEQAYAKQIGDPLFGMAS